MADWSKPSLTDPYASVLAELMARDISSATLSYSNDANVPNGAIRWNSSTCQFETYNASNGSWGPWSAQLNVGSLWLDGTTQPGTMFAVPRSQADQLYQPAGNYAAAGGNSGQPVFVGPATQPTQAPQMQQLQALLGSYSQVLAPYFGGTLSSTQVNCYIQINGAVTLPTPNTVAAGSTITLKNDSQSPQNISVSSGGFLFSPGQIPGNGRGASISLEIGDDVLLVSRGGSEWDIAGGAWLVRNLVNPFYTPLGGSFGQPFSASNLNIGAPWPGSVSGVLMNMPAGYGDWLLQLGIAGVQKFRVDNVGNAFDGSGSQLANQAWVAAQGFLTWGAINGLFPASSAYSTYGWIGGTWVIKCPWGSQTLIIQGGAVYLGADASTNVNFAPSFGTLYGVFPVCQQAAWPVGITSYSNNNFTLQTGGNVRGAATIGWMAIGLQ